MCIGASACAVTVSDEHIVAKDARIIIACFMSVKGRRASVSRSDARHVYPTTRRGSLLCLPDDFLLRSEPAVNDQSSTDEGDSRFDKSGDFTLADLVPILLGYEHDEHDCCAPYRLGLVYSFLLNLSHVHIITWAEPDK
jgi:hypothetical protein